MRKLEHLLLHYSHTITILHTVILYYSVFNKINYNVFFRDPARPTKNMFNKIPSSFIFHKLIE